MALRVEEGRMIGGIMTMTEPLLGPDGTPVRVTVLIPTINNADELDIVLDRLGKQTYPHFDVVIVDSQSKDHTKDVALKHSARWIEDPSTNRADACTYGLERIDTDLVLFTDDDTIPPLDWVEKLVRWFEDPEVGGVGGPNFAPDEDPFGAKCADVAFCTRFMTAGRAMVLSRRGPWSPSSTIPASIAHIGWRICVRWGSSSQVASELRTWCWMPRSSEQVTSCSSIPPMSCPTAVGVHFART